MILRRLVRLGDGGVRVTLPPAERALLLDMTAAIRGVIADVDADTPPTDLTGRLFPRAYEDPLEQMQYADSMMSPLVEGKRTMLDTFETSLHSGTNDAKRWRADLDGDQVAAWLAVLQDGRQVLSRIVGIQTEQDWERIAETGDESAIVLNYLGGLLDGLVQILMGDFEDGTVGDK